MKNIPEYIKIIFFKILNEEIKLKEFEKWVYLQNDLDKYLTIDDYLSIIELNYSNKLANYQINKIIKNYVDYSEFEAYKILTLFDNIRNKRDNLNKNIICLYDLYCDGYGFLEEIALKYGLSVIDLQNDSNSFNIILNEFFPNLILLINNIEILIKEKHILLVPTSSELKKYAFVDNRNSK